MGGLHYGPTGGRQEKIFFFKKVLQNVRSKLKNIRTYFLSMKKYSKPPVINHKMSNLWLKLRVFSVLVLR